MQIINASQENVRSRAGAVVSVFFVILHEVAESEKSDRTDSPLRSCDCAQDDEECTILPYRTTFRRALTVQRSCTTNRARKGALHCTAVGRAPHWHLLDALRPLHGYVRPIVVSRRVWRV